MSTRASLVATVCLIAVTTGCGSGGDSTTTTPTIDPAKIEPTLRDRLSQSAGVDPSGVSVDCPSGEPAEEGRQFNCTLTASDGTTATVRVTVTSAVVSGGQVDYHVHGVVPKSQFK
ncbi:MAG TPA: DUF4333 domain-containing protein [Solirubrobacterales bacterium]|nr:DUF4333 domain-containing protein [Solirubrobacterales bacterium]